MGKLTASIVLASVLEVGLPGGEVAAQGQPDGQLTIAFHASIAPTFLDPAEPPLYFAAPYEDIRLKKP